MAECITMLRCLNIIIMFAWFLDANNSQYLWGFIICTDFMFWEVCILITQDSEKSGYFFHVHSFNYELRNSRKFCRNPSSKQCLPILCTKWVKNPLNRNFIYYTALTHFQSAVNPVCWRCASVAYIMPGACFCSFPNPFHIYIVEILSCHSGKKFKQTH